MKFVTLTSKERIDLKGLLSTSIASAITAGGNGSDPHLNRHDPSFLQRMTARSLSAFLLQMKSAR